MVVYNPLHPHCGPFNTVSEYKSPDETDEICRLHDIAYGTLKNAYLEYNTADEQFQQDVAEKGDLIANVYYRPVFWVKEVAGTLGVLPSNIGSKRTAADAGFYVDNRLVGSKRGKSGGNTASKNMPYYVGRDEKPLQRKHAYRRRNRYGSKPSDSMRKYIYRAIEKKLNSSVHHSMGVYCGQSNSSSNTTGSTAIKIFTLAGMRSLLEAIPWVTSITAGVPTAENLTSSTTAVDSIPYIAPVLTGYSLEVYWRNNSSFPVYLLITQIVAKEDSTDPFTTAKTSGLTALHNATAPKYLALTFYDSPACQEAWYMGDPVRVKLEPGEEYSYTIGKRHCNYPINVNALKSRDALTHVGGWTRGIVWQQQGPIAHDQTTTTNVGIGPSYVDYKYTQHFWLRSGLSTMKRKTMNSDGGGSTLTTPIIFNEIQELEQKMDQ